MAYSLIKKPTLGNAIGAITTAPTAPAPPKPPVPTVAAAAQLQAIKNPAANGGRPAMSAPAPRPNLPTPTQMAAPGGAGGVSPGGFDLVMKNGSPNVSSDLVDRVKTDTTFNIDRRDNAEKPDADSQLAALRKSYLGTFDTTPEEKAAQEKLDAITARQEMLKANEYAGEQNVAEQAIPFSLIGGQQAALQRQLAAKLGQEAATAVPLTTQLARIQAQQKAMQEKAKAEIGFATPDYKTVGEGQSLVDPVTGKIAYQGTPKAKTEPQPTASIQEYNFAKDNGYTGSFTEYQNEDANRKALSVRPADDPNRKLSATEAQALGVPFGTTAGDAYGKNPTKPLTDAQSKEQAFGTRAQEANGYIEKLAPGIVGMNSLSYSAQVAAEPSAVGNAFVSDQIRQVRQAERNFLNAILRRESGAVISPSEFAEGAKQYFPQPGDDAQTLAQKAQNRQTAYQSMLNSVPNQQQSSATYTAPDGTQYQQGADGLYYPKASSGKPTASTNGDAKAIAAAIRKVESNGNYNARGGSGEFGAYQFMPATWRGWAQTYLGNSNAPMTPENQDRVAESHIADLLAQGRTPEQIALIWNGGQPVRKAGVNSHGVRYDSGAYAEKVLRALNG